ncbi:MAG: DNA-binding NarL/FixJ family response regulator [Paracoccaceae bacterium]|jgi:DNA-binding NarL/FixJ family response regulator
MYDTIKISASSMPVLIADHDEYFRVALNTILTDRLDVPKVIETSSFDEALECLPAHPELSMALFALDMPGMDNWVDLHTVRELFPKLRVVVVSASQERQDILMALESGVHGYVSKAASVDELSEALSMICKGFVYIPPIFPDLPTHPEQNQYFALGEAKARTINYPHVTPRQKEIIELLVTGKSNKEMARAMDISEGTVKFHLSSAFRLLNATNRVEAATAGMDLLQHIVEERVEA